VAGVVPALRGLWRDRAVDRELERVDAHLRISVGGVAFTAELDSRDPNSVHELVRKLGAATSGESVANGQSAETAA
jgi:hypothetical protein